MAISKYGSTWPDKFDAVQIELGCIKRGGNWIGSKGQECGAGLFHHFMEARKLIWPKRARHKWVDLIYQEILGNMVTILMGPFSCGKTSIASEYVLLDYWANYENTLVMLSTTSVDKLKSAVFGEISMLWEAGKKRFPHLAGHMLDHKNAITTDRLQKYEEDREDDQAFIRDMRKGIVGKACFQGQKWVGLGVYSGIKQERIRFLADELQFMPGTFFDCLPNMIGSVQTDANNQPQIKIIGSGNPKHDPFDMLGKAAEPETGWSSIGMIEKTTAWVNKFQNGRTINLIGLDSPNFDVPDTERIPYPYLVNRRTIEAVAKTWGRESLKFNEQCVGRMMLGFTGDRVITAELCENNGAKSRAMWLDTKRTRIGFIDPSWTSIGDRCVWGWLEFGEDINGGDIIRFGGTYIIPLVGGVRDEPDDQIAAYVKSSADMLGIQPENIFYGSTGRGTTGAAFAKVFGHRAPVPIAEGGIPSSRAVWPEELVDEGNGTRRPKRCDEAYSKFITELWFNVRNIIKAGQMRELTEEVITEGCSRRYTTVKGHKIEVESKEDMKETLGRSPDLFDALSFGVEGALQRGFVLKKLGAEVKAKDQEPDWFEEEAERYESLIKGKMLQHV